MYQAECPLLLSEHEKISIYERNSIYFYTIRPVCHKCKLSKAMARVKSESGLSRVESQVVQISDSSRLTDSSERDCSAVVLLNN